LFRTRADTFKSGIDDRATNRVEATDITHLGLVYPYEVYTPSDPIMTNIVEQLHGRQQSGKHGSRASDQQRCQRSHELAGVLCRGEPGRIS
jgi:hypothetical protein